VLSCHCEYDKVGTKIRFNVEFDSKLLILVLDNIKHAKCSKGHTLDCNDCALIDDYDYVSALYMSALNYWNRNPTIKKAKLGKFDKEYS